MIPTPSSLMNVSAGVVSGRGLPHAVTVEQMFTANANGIVRWDLQFKSNSPRPFGSASLGSWLALGAGRATSRPLPKTTTMWAPYGAQAAFSPAGYLEPFPMRNFSWSYGVRGGTNTIGIPLAMLAQDATTVSLALSANDTIVDLDLTAMQSVTTGATIGFGRLRHRIGGGVTMRSTQYIRVAKKENVEVPADWRALLGWYVRKYESFFVPDARSGVESFSGGTAQYCDLRLQNYSSDLIEKVGLTVNWDATFAWDWWGNFFPNQSTFERCTCVGHQDGGSDVRFPFTCFQNGSRADGLTPSDPSAVCEQLSHELVASWYAQAQANGIATLLYQDPNEWGAQIVPANVNISRETCSENNHSTFCTANRLFRKEFEPAALAGSGGPGTLRVLPVGYITPGLILLDALYLPYQDWIVDMAKRMVDELPVAGIAWDRSDHTTLLNGRLDDGIAWDATTDNVTSWLGSGWTQVVERVAEVFHAAGKAMVHNTYTNRMDFMKFMDAIYDENGDQSWRTSTDAILGLSKPVWLWDHCGSQERDKKVPTCGRDADGTYAWLATSFFFGAQATTPYPPCGDHTTTSTNIAPGTLQVYKDFAPFWPLLQHKKWVLVPRAVAVNGTLQHTRCTHHICLAHAVC